MGDSVFQPEPGELADMLSQSEKHCPPPIITDFESLGCSPLFSDVIRLFQYNIWMVDNAMLNAEAYFCTGRTTQQLRYIPVAGEEGTLMRYVCESMRWACTLAAFLPFAKDYPNPSLFINSQVHKLRETLAGLVKCAPPDHALLPWLFSVGAVVALPTERSVSFVFSKNLPPPNLEIEVTEWYSFFDLLVFFSVSFSVQRASSTKSYLNIDEHQGYRLRADHKSLVVH